MVGGSIDILVGLIFLEILYDHTVAMLQHFIFVLIRYLLVWKIWNKRLVLLTEHIEESLSLSRAAIECTLDRHTALIVVLLIVGEYHQLRNVEEAAEARLAHTGVYAFTLRQNTLMIIGLLHLDKSQW